jgi:hypothetical protein
MVAIRARLPLRPDYLSLLTEPRYALGNLMTTVCGPIPRGDPELAGIAIRGA